MKTLKWTAPVLMAIAICISSMAHGGQPLALKVFNMDGLHVDDNGLIYAAEGFTGARLFVITPDGQVFIQASGLAGPIDIANDSEGNLYVSNFNDATVSKITPDGEVSKFADVLPGPAGLVVDSKDNVIVSHYGVGNGDGTTLLRIAPNGAVDTLSTGGLLLAPVATAIDDEDNVYVANFQEGSIIKISPQGDQTLLTKIDAPDGFAIGHMAFAKDKLYATAIAGRAVLTIRMNGKVRERRARIDEGRFPNGLTYDAENETILFTYGFSPVADIERIHLGGQ